MHTYSQKKISIEDLKDEQQTLWFYNFLLVRGWLNNPSTPLRSFSELNVKTEVLRSLENINVKSIAFGPSRNAPETAFNEINLLYNASVIQNSDYAFIKKLSSRLKFALWMHIRQLEIDPEIKHDGLNVRLFELRFKLYQYLPKGPLYPRYAINSYPLTVEEHTKAIIQFLQICEASSEFKTNYISKFRELIPDIAKFKSAFDWLVESDTYQCNWAANYMKFRGIYQESFPIEPGRSLLDSIVVSFDLWTTSYEAKKLFLFEMKRAWSTKKSRDKQVGKKPFSFVMSKKVSKMLDNLIADNGLSKSEFVENLIADAHRDKIEH
ncbi:hypothetical protein [Rheinheimera tangshanensis]|uniref:Uncharacterized protein n=1 Tax=Rheinheimera tangshanensis TaxID=400153 RepID=A0A5C8M4B6_9GAMM|nr:hypothetical protein [Rheinheimera tangshanensis]TXK83305.1 hypothetical protein FU839_03260 [Rheinheimera tangshanensis]GGM44624.1 hypothetical protein GCM10010920_01150 [Rheinheimera tangshanensis]